jgi:hypothetical protein
VQVKGVIMKVVISQARYCHENEQLFHDYSILEKWKNKGKYIEYITYDDCSNNNFKDLNHKLYWLENSLILDLNNDEMFKIIQQLTSYSELIIGYVGKYEHEKYGVDFYIKIYDYYVE